MNNTLILKASLTAFCIIVFGSMLLEAFLAYSNQLYLAASFLINSFVAGVYVYQNADKQKALQATVTVLSVPFLFILFFVALVFVSALPGGGGYLGRCF